jgi:hypothetical protein
MDEFINENEEISVPLEPSPHLRHANANDIIEWLIKNDQDDEALGTFPTVWCLLETRIRKHSNEVIEADDDGDLPIHDVLRFLHTRWMLQPLFPSSNVSGSHLDGRYIQNEYGDIPLHFALRHPFIVCFRMSFTVAMSM